VTVRIDRQRVEKFGAELKKQGIALRIGSDEVNDFVAASICAFENPTSN
jgi:hypothetical protein